MLSLEGFNLTKALNNSFSWNRTQVDGQCLYMASWNSFYSLSFEGWISAWPPVVPEIWSSEISSFPVEFSLQTVHCVTNSGGVSQGVQTRDRKLWQGCTFKGKEIWDPKKKSFGGFWIVDKSAEMFNNKFNN